MSKEETLKKLNKAFPSVIDEKLTEFKGKTFSSNEDVLYWLEETLHDVSVDAWREGYNKCLKDEKITDIRKFV